MTDSEQDSWHSEIVYLVRAYAAWYLVKAVVNSLPHLDSDPMVLAHIRGYVRDAHWALEALQPPAHYHVLHQDLLDSFVSVANWMHGTSNRSVAEIAAVFSSVGMEIQQQMTVLGLDYDRFS